MYSKLKKKSLSPAEPRKFPLGSLVQWVILTASLFLFIYFLGQVNELHCVRSQAGQADCTYQTKILGLIPIREKKAVGLLAARVDESCTGEDCKYRILLFTNTGTVPMQEAYTADRVVKDQVVKQINTFASSSDRTSLTVKEEVHPAVLGIIAAILLGMFAYMIVSLRRSRQSS